MSGDRLLPALPEVEGLRERLLGAPMPPLVLDSTRGRIDVRELGRDRLVLFLYPHATGLPVAPVPGWEEIPGARGCTAQACAFRDHHADILSACAELGGLSVQTIEEQRLFAERVVLRYRLISDPDRRVAEALDLPTFTAGGRVFYQRLTLVVEKGRIAQVFYPILAPERNAADVAAWLESRLGRPRERRAG